MERGVVRCVSCRRENGAGRETRKAKTNTTIFFVGPHFEMIMSTDASPTPAPARSSMYPLTNRMLVAA